VVVPGNVKAVALGARRGRKPKGGE
jgi:hypothetical protein